MKTIEEKAKAYDEAISRAKVKIAGVDRKDRVYYVNDIEEIFPELKESEDERIRKEIIDSIKNNMAVVHKEAAIAWLDKQGEQKPAEWSEEDEAIYYGVIETEQYMLDVVNGIKKFNVGNISIKEECTRELNWLKSLKDRVQPQPKQEWSEEDEQLYNDLSDTYFYNDEDYPEETYKLMLKRVLDWMTKRAKSLRPQSTWKPSDYELEVLKLAAEKDGTCLMGLYEQLKKLREE